MTKQLEALISSEIADFFAGFVEIHTELGGPNTVEEAQWQLTERVTRIASECEAALIAALEQSQQSEEVAELLRDKVKRLESDLWDKEQLRKVYSEKSFDLEQTISSMKHEHAKNQSWLAGQVREMEDALCKLLPGCHYMDEPDGGDVSPLEQVARMVADYRQKIAELEAGKLAVKLPSLKQTESGERYVWADGVYNFKQDVVEVLRAAGITVQGDD